MNDSLNYEINILGQDQAIITYHPITTTSSSRRNLIDDTCLKCIHDKNLPNLIIEEHKHKTWHPSIELPPLSKLTYITNLSIRFINIANDHISLFPPNLIVLNIYCSSIRVLDNLPNTLKFIVLSTNTHLTHVVLPPSLISFEASYQTKLTTITFPPTITYLRFYQCAFTRLNRLTFRSIQACTITRPCFIECINPYTDVRINQRIKPYNAQPHLVFDCIQSVNRELDEDITSVLYRLRENSYSSTKIDCPIINALRLASNPPRRFSEFIVE
jgi:hypothetical protein